MSVLWIKAASNIDQNTSIIDFFLERDLESFYIKSITVPRHEEESSLFTNQAKQHHSFYFKDSLEEVRR